MRYVSEFRVFVVVASLVLSSGCYLEAKVDIPAVIPPPPVYTCETLNTAPADEYCDLASAYADPTTYGTGTSSAPYEICSPYQLNAIGSDPSLFSKRFKLTADLDMRCISGNHTRIGSATSSFKGVFDGNSKTIRNWTFTDSTVDDVGLFGYSEGGSVHDLAIVDARVVGKQSVAIAMGRSDSAHLLRVVVSGSLSGDTWVGGIVGRDELGAVEQCGSSATITGRNDVGGLVGNGGTPILVSNFFSGLVLATGTNTGGIVGNAGFGYVLNSYSTGTISSSGPNVGGILGAGGANLRNCYAAGSVSGTTGIGGIVGNSGLTIRNCFSIASVSGAAGSMTNVGVLRGAGAGSMTNNHYWTGVTCDADRNTGGTQACGTTSQGTQATATNFQSMNVEPLASWDFEGESVVGTFDHWALPSNSYPVPWSIDRQAVGIPFFTGRGTEDDPYVISTAGEFNLIGSNPRWMDAHYKLGANIDFAGAEAKTIGTYAAPFRGTFDGDGKTISNFTISQSTSAFIGLFGILLHPGRVENLTVNGAKVVASGFSGILAGHTTGEISNVIVAGTVTTGYHGGGLVGLARVPGAISDSKASVMFNLAGTFDGAGGGLVGNNGTLIQRSVAAATMTGGNQYFGGLVGFMTTNGIVLNSMSSGSIGTSSHNRIGGLVGYMTNGSRVEKSYSTAMVRGLNHSGGLVGWVQSSASTITDSFATGDVRGNGGSTLVGPLVGQSAGTIVNSYVNSGSFCDSQNAVGTQACNTVHSGGVALATFNDPSNLPLSSWDFVTTWQSDLLSLPVLR